jgi:hypothetical protein
MTVRLGERTGKLTHFPCPLVLIRPCLRGIDIYPPPGRYKTLVLLRARASYEHQQRLIEPRLMSMMIRQRSNPLLVIKTSTVFPVHVDSLRSASFSVLLIFRFRSAGDWAVRKLGGFFLFFLFFFFFLGSVHRNNQLAEAYDGQAGSNGSARPDPNPGPFPYTWTLSPLRQSPTYLHTDQGL